jgi:hypothetical protein
MATGVQATGHDAGATHMKAPPGVSPGGGSHVIKGMDKWMQYCFGHRNSGMVLKAAASLRQRANNACAGRRRE